MTALPMWQGLHPASCSERGIWSADRKGGRMSEAPEERVEVAAFCCGTRTSRRDVLAAASVLGLSAALAHAAEPADERPKEGDHLVAIDATAPVALEPIDISSPQVIAWPMDPASKLVRSGS